MKRLEFSPLVKGSIVEIIASRRPDLVGARMTVARYIKSRAVYLLYPMDGHEFTFDAWEAFAENVRQIATVQA